MRIGFMTEQSRREMLASFVIAYKMVLQGHELYAPEATARCIREAAGLKVNCFLPGNMGGINQLISQIERNELDAMIYFYSPGKEMQFDFVANTSQFGVLLRTCDEYCIPLATNLGSAEVLIMGIANGDLDWKNS
ncbi:MAG: methylglyoxal synthase [Lachnospiraceae bacterium]|nr:methylglyoxal synthase [Lachnospiraceae bacterium]